MSELTKYDIMSDADPETYQEGDQTAGLLSFLGRGAKTLQKAPKPAVNPALKFFESDPLSAAMKAAQDSYVMRRAQQGVPEERAIHEFMGMTREQKLAEWK